MHGSGLPARRRGVAVLTVALISVLLVGCVDSSPPEPVDTPTQHASESPTPSPEPTPEIDLDGTAGQNQAYFDLVNQRLIAAGGNLGGRAFIDNLVAAGYPKGDMEVTPDRTSTGDAADNIQFSIRLNGTCLIGQYGNIGYASSFGPLLTTGGCLAGKTRPIDW
jgi:hypothetical protein